MDYKAEDVFKDPDFINKFDAHKEAENKKLELAKKTEFKILVDDSDIELLLKQINNITDGIDVKNDRNLKDANLFSRQESMDFYNYALKKKDFSIIRDLCKEDLFFLLCIACRRPDVNRDWIYNRCREVEADPDGNLDLWARGHYKSSIITFALTIQDILKNPDVTIGIFSHTRPIAKAFLNQIKRELELNTFLQKLFPDVLYANPTKESPRWSLDDGIVVRRKSNPKESTVEAWGLVDGQPTSKHYKILIYDDVVTLDSVTTPEMIDKVTNALSMSFNLASRPHIKRFIGTRYHSNDTWKTVIDRGIARIRKHPATHNGKLDGNPVFLTKAELDQKLKDDGSYVFSSQQLLNPLADRAMGFLSDWLMFYTYLKVFNKWNFYIVVDPANEKNKKSDYTVMSVIGLAPDRNYYLVDGVRDRMNLTERTRQLFTMVRKWNPIITGYEKYGMQSDIDHIRYVQEEEGYRFPIVELGGSMSKNDRIRKLVPLFENHRFYLPYKLLYGGVDGKMYDFIQLFKEEYDNFPVCIHDDVLDCIARITDEGLGAVFPKEEVAPLRAMAAPEAKYDVFKINLKMI